MRWRYQLLISSEYLISRVAKPLTFFLLQGSGWPSDLYQSLVELTPQIEVIGKSEVLFCGVIWVFLMFHVLVAVFSIEEMIRKTHNLGAPGAVPFVHPQDLPEDGDSSMGEVSQPPEDIRGGSITIAEDQRTLEWPHTVLMDRKANGGTPCQAAISKDGQYVAVGYEDTGIRLWHVDREEPEYILRGHGDVVQCVDFSPDGQVLASGSDDSTIILWDIHSGLQLQQIFDDSLGTLSTTFSPDGKILITGSQDPSLKFWDMETITSGVHEPFAIHSDFSSSVQAVAFTPDSSRAISCSDQQGRIWESQSGELIHTMEGHEGTIWALAVSHNGARAATGSEDHTARIWSVQTGEELVTIREHRGAIWSVKFSPDDRWVIAGSYDSTISISRTSTGECLHILSGHTSVVHAVAYSPVGDLVASGAADGTVKLWDGKHGKAIAEMKGHADKIKSLRFSPNCDDLFSSSDDGTVRGWSTLDVLRIA